MVPPRQSQTAFTVFLFYASKLEGLTICECDTEEALFPQLLKTLGPVPGNMVKFNPGLSQILNTVFVV